MFLQNTDLNIVPGGIIPVMHVSQYDVGRELKFVLYDGYDTADITTGTTVTIEGTKPDGHGFQYSGVLNQSAHTATFVTTEQMTVLAGAIECKLTLYLNSQRIGTALFILDVEKAGINDSTIISDTELPLIIAQATEQMERAEAAADAAALSETNAATSETNAAASETNAANSEIICGSFMRMAGVSAASAEQSAIISGSFMRTAGNYADEAEASAASANVNALKSEGHALGTQNGTPVSSDSPYYHNNAKYWADEARQSSAGGVAARVIATAEPTNISTHAYAIGDQFVYNGILYTATSAISVGATITPGTNCSISDTITEQIGNAGHTILDEDGVTYPQRSKLQFEGCEVTDDAVNGVTVVKCEGGETVIVDVPTVTNTELIYDGTAKSPTITRDTAYTTVTGTTEATEFGSYTFTISLAKPSYMWTDNTTRPKTYIWGVGYDGSTITPVNDIQTWLKCAMITDKSYTTLSEVLNDHETLYLLLGNENATDYLVRSTSWVSDITSDETAMNYIGRWNYCADTLLADSTWRTAICDSTYMESVLNAKAPKPLNNNDNIVYSAKYEDSPDYQPYMAFDNVIQSQQTTPDAFKCYAPPYNSLPQWLGYHFASPITVYYVIIYPRIPSGSLIKKYKVQASNDGTTWTDLTSIIDTNAPSGQVSTQLVWKTNFNNNQAYSYYRVYVTESTDTADNWFTIDELQFYGRSDVTENQIDIYSAASDTVYYLDNGSPVTVCTTDTAGHASIDRTTLPNGTYTLYSSVAKDPNNLSNGYSKSVTINGGTVEIKVMPDGALYWYGYGADNIVIPPNTSQNNNNYINSLGTTVTKNTNNVTGVNTSSPNLCTVGCYVEMDVTDISNVYVYGADLSIASKANCFFSAYLYPLTAKKSDNTIAYNEKEIYQYGTQKTLDGNEHKELITMDVSTYTGNKYVVGGGASNGTGRTKIKNRVYAIWGA